MKKGTLLHVVKGIVLAYMISGAILLALSFLMFKWDISEGVVRGGIIFSYVISCFVSGMMVSRHSAGRRYLWGILMGGLYYTVLLVTSMICNQAVFTDIPGILPALFLCVFGGMLGGMMQAGKR